VLLKQYSTQNSLVGPGSGLVYVITNQTLYTALRIFSDNYLFCKKGEPCIVAFILF